MVGWLANRRMASDTERETLERQWNEYEALIAIFDGDEHITLEFSSSFEASE